jgi:hypothetical protein
MITHQVTTLLKARFKTNRLLLADLSNYQVTGYKITNFSIPNITRPPHPHSQLISQTNHRKMNDGRRINICKSSLTGNVTKQMHLLHSPNTCQGA